VHGEAEGGLQDLLLLQARAQAQAEPGDRVRQLSGQLGPSPAQEKVHDREVVRLTAGGKKGLGPGPGQSYAIPLAPEERGQGLPAAGVRFHEQNRPGGAHCSFIRKQWAYQPEVAVLPRRGLGGGPPAGFSVSISDPERREVRR
jgi:hypothetical protein